jgi:hypothetical protein
VQPSDQALIPYLFHVGPLEEGENTLTWPDTFDAIVVDLEIYTSLAPADQGVLLQATSGSPIASALIGEDASGGGGFGQWRGFVVAPAGTELALYTASSDMWANVSGWLLTPPTATFFPV